MSVKENQILIEELGARHEQALEDCDWTIAAQIEERAYDMSFCKESREMAEARNEAMLEQLTKFGDDPKYAPGELRHA